MEIKIVDTTLRDGEQKAGIALGVKDKIAVAKLLDELNVYQIEAGTPAMGGDEKRSIEEIAQLGLNSKISAWNRMNIDDIKHSLDCRVDIIHISAPTSDIQISTKLNKDRKWVIDTLKSSISYAVSKGAMVTIGMEDASRANYRFLLEVVEAAVSEGAQRVRYADTVGILHRQRAFEVISQLRKDTGVDIEIHAHNDFGMAVANSLWAAKAGALYINSTIGGLGERAGNCDYLKFIEAARFYLGKYRNLNMKEVLDKQLRILDIVRGRYLRDNCVS